MNVARHSLIALMYFTGWFLREAIMLNWSWENKGGLHNGNCNFGFKCNANQNEKYCFLVKTIDYMKFKENNTPLHLHLPPKGGGSGGEGERSMIRLDETMGPQKLKTELILWIPIKHNLFFKCGS